uniref:sugar transporter ERD6-like 7 n=1 Tax=Erigeron canadensis TaxID=72917 RepID=UPI001CB90E4A|nr:sugar transporter ERD6-like 7 [Erigeron canadensis]
MVNERDIEKRDDRVQDDRVPLISQDETRKENNFMVYLSTFVAVCGSFSFGTGVGYSSPTEASIKKDLNLTIAQYSLFGSILTFGAMIGAVASGPMSDFFGRKGALRISSAFCIGGWLAIYLAQGPVPLDAGRLATGYGMGVFSYVVPVFIAEIAPRQLRGLLTAANQLLIATGTSVSFVIGTLLHWRTMALIGLIPCAVLLVGLFFIPESPRWLAKIGNQVEFDLALQKLRGKDVNVSEAADEIKEYIETLEELPKARLIDLFQRRYLRSVIIGVGLMIFQQFGGINGICFYATSIFASAGFSADIGNIIYAILQVVVTTLNALFIDKAGRKPLLLVSATGMALGCLLAAASFYIKTYQIALAAAPALAVTGILLYIVGYSLGMGAVPWVIMSEIFSIDVKRTAGGLVTLVNWAGAWAVSYTFNFLFTWSCYGTFLLYAAVNVACILFVIKLVPETKRQTLEQIQAGITH